MFPGSTNFLSFGDNEPRAEDIEPQRRPDGDEEGCEVGVLGVSSSSEFVADEAGASIS